MENSCSGEPLGLQVRQVSVRSTVLDLQRTLNNISLMASGAVLSSKELQYATLQWYRNGHRITSVLSTLQRNARRLSLTQELQVFNATFEHSGRYEVLLKIDMYTYLLDSSCQAYYYDFVHPYLTDYKYPYIQDHYVSLARGYVDVHYYRGTQN